MENQLQKRPGRPEKDASGLDVRDELLQIATELFSQKGYDSVSLREICKSADVTPAMIPYYFGDKSGLLNAVMQSAFEKLLAITADLSETQESGSLTELFIDRYFEFLNENPWFPQIMSREVMSKETKLRKLFLNNMVRPSLEYFPSFIKKDIDRGYLRSGLDPEHAILSLIGMCDFAYTVAPVMGEVLGYTTDETFNASYRDHVKNLFMTGAAN